MNIRNLLRYDNKMNWKPVFLRNLSRNGLVWMFLVMTDNKRKNRFIEELDDDTPMEMSVMGDDGRFYNTIRELIEANERFAKLQREKESKDKSD